MANAIVEAYGPSGMTMATIKLCPYSSDTVANGTGDALVEETVRKGVYRAIVTEGLTGWHYGIVYDDSGEPIGLYHYEMSDVAIVHRGENDPGQEETAGRPISKAGWLRRIMEWAENKITRDNSNGEQKLLSAADDTTPLSTKVQATTGNVDSETRGT